MNWGTTKKNDAKKSQEKVTELHPPVTNSSSNSANTKATNTQIKQRAEDLESGMELLDLDFLLSLIENTEGTDKNDIIMRKLCFNEVLRRDQQNEIDSFALKTYAMNEANLYGKNIQCEAMKELAVRTEHGAKG